MKVLIYTLQFCISFKTHIHTHTPLKTLHLLETTIQLMKLSETMNDKKIVWSSDGQDGVLDNRIGWK